MAKKVKKTPGRGGAGRGQGRKMLPRGEERVTASVRLLQHDLDWLKAQGKLSAVVCQAVKEYRERIEDQDHIPVPPGGGIQLRIDGGKDVVDSKCQVVKKQKPKSKTIGIGKACCDYSRSLIEEGVPSDLRVELVRSKAQEYREGDHIGLPENLRRAIASRKLKAQLPGKLNALTHTPPHK